jgi:hypothetical protein
MCATFDVEVLEKVDDDCETLTVDGLNIDLVRVTGEGGRTSGYRMLKVPALDVVEWREVHVEASILYHLCGCSVLLRVGQRCPVDQKGAQGVAKGVEARETLVSVGETAKTLECERADEWIEVRTVFAVYV